MKSYIQSQLRLAVVPRLFFPAAVFMLCLTLSGPVVAAMLAGSVPKDWPANPELHQVTVRREAADQKQSAMIAAAEAALPSKETLQLAAGDAAVPEGDKVWWYEEQLGIRIPCAITADAVAYYSGLVEKYGKQDLKRYMEPSSQLDYHATVAFLKEFKHQGKVFKEVHVVTMKLAFSEQFVATQTEGMRFQKERVVVLDADGKVLLITGDGRTVVRIMAI